MSDSLSPGADQALAERLQQALDRDYLLGPVLGRGGFGVVFAARDLVLQRDVAVKLLRPELAAPLLRERFRREAEAAAGLRHPGIVPIFAVGEQQDLTWFVMPRIAGETLGRWLDREGRLPIGEARRILAETAHALGAAHQAGLIHRDIKPDSILLEGEERRVALTDFGIAKSLTATPGSGGSLTTSGLIVGTPDYMSPEQAGGAGDIDPRSDLYSLGVVGFQMLTGELPFGDGLAGRVLPQQLRGPAPSVRQKRPECPAAIALAVDRCLMLERDDRWPSTGALLEALSRSSVPRLEVEASGERSGTPGPRGAAEISRFRQVLVITAVVVLAAAGVDLIRGIALLAPVTLLAGAGFVAARYGSLWTLGYGWEEVFGLHGAANRANGPSPHPAVYQARSDRAAILRLLQDWPRAERDLVADLPARVDEAVARIEALSRELERSLEESAALASGPARERGQARLRELQREVQVEAEPLVGLLALLQDLRRGGLTGRRPELDAALRRLARPTPPGNRPGPS